MHCFPPSWTGSCALRSSRDSNSIPCGDSLTGVSNSIQSSRAEPTRPARNRSLDSTVLAPTERPAYIGLILAVSSPDLGAVEPSSGRVPGSRILSHSQEGSNDEALGGPADSRVVLAREPGR